MSREIDFINFINERTKLEENTYTPTTPLTNRDYLEKALKCLDEYTEEKDALLKYQEILLRIETEQDPAITEVLQETKVALEVHLKDVIASEKKKSYSETMKVELETIKRYRQIYDQKREQERIERQKKYAEVETIEQIPQHQNREYPILKQEKAHLNCKRNIMLAVLLSIIFALLELVLFYIADFVAVFILALIFGVLSYIPILNIITNLLFTITGNAADIFTVTAGAILAAGATAFIMSKISKNKETLNRSFCISSIILVVLNVLFLIVNLIHNDPCYTNAVMIFLGICVFFSEKNI